VLAIPLTLVCALMALNQWVGYYPTLQKAWGDLTSGPLPDQIDAKDLAGLRNTHPDTGKLVPVDIPDGGSGFKHRQEFVYLPPIWFTGEVPPKLPAVMIVAGEFSNPTNWIRTGSAIQVIDDYAKGHGGAAPVFVFVDSSGSFNNDTECVTGPRGNAADHLTKEVRPYVISQFGTSSGPADWAVVDWSSGGTRNPICSPRSRTSGAIAGPIPVCRTSIRTAWHPSGSAGMATRKSSGRRARYRTYARPQWGWTSNAHCVCTPAITHGSSGPALSQTHCPWIAQRVHTPTVPG
jgi:hypothetical protein